MQLSNKSFVGTVIGCIELVEELMRHSRTTVTAFIIIIIIIIIIVIISTPYRSG
jgi:hypothetical protein